jgi:hypothetical protein
VLRVIGAGTGVPRDGDAPLRTPYGLRFSGDGATVCVADPGANRVAVFQLADGGLVRHLTHKWLLRPMDVEEVQDGWLVACRGAHTIEFVGSHGGDAHLRGTFLGKRAPRPGDCAGRGDLEGPTALAAMPCLGLFVRETGNGGRLHVYATPDDVAVAGMPAMRVAWIVAVVRGGAARHRHTGVSGVMV